MTMVMQWQRHQVQIERDRAQLRQLLDTHAGRVEVPEKVVAAAERLGAVTAAEMIEPGDSRARG